jgi:hypothetical protein
MLVYLKKEMGHCKIDKYRIYGKKYAYGTFGSTDIPPEMYKKNKDILEEAEYTRVWLENKFDAIFPDVTFRMSDLYKMDFNSLVSIIRSMGVDYIMSARPTQKEKRALCRSIKKFLS